METRHESTSSSTDQQAALALSLPHDPQGRLPVSVMLIWLCAFAGLAAYTASWFVPSLAQAAH